MKLPEKFWIVIHSNDHSKLVQEKLFEHGYSWKRCGKTYPQETITSHPSYKYGDLTLYVNKIAGIIQYGSKGLYHSKQEYGVQVSTDDLLSTKAIKQKSVRLNDEHEAIVSGDGTIKVGCQTFSHNIIKDLAEAIKEVTK